jgi:Holliday junction resolvase RusA-like endonuclease
MPASFTMSVPSGWSVYARFRVYGIPKPGGSKKAGLVYGKDGEPVTRISKSGKRIPVIAVRDDCDTVMQWRDRVASTAVEAGYAMLPRGTPAAVSYEFIRARPKGHFRDDGSIRRKYLCVMPTSKPDVLKLARSTEDALTGILWHDDAESVAILPSKRYAELNESAGCLVTVWVPSVEVEIDRA